MSRYAIADIGSNTVVLLIYEIAGSTLRQLKYISTPVHLISHVADGVMSQEGIDKAVSVLKEYRNISDEMNISWRWADVTEPCRIANRDELISALEETGWEIYPLSGEQEALYDFTGAKIAYPDVKDGIAFDVGGGSTELIAFKDGKATDAMSFHLGCVRLAHMPLDTGTCRIEIDRARQEYPGLNIQADSLIGIGGTARAAGLVAEIAFGDRHVIKTDDLRLMFDKLIDHDYDMEAIVKKVVDPARQPVFLPGLHMILEIAAAFEAKTIYISDTGIREGFLLARIKNLNGKN